MKVPLLDLKAQYATIRDQVRVAVDAVMDSQYFILGPEVAAFEDEVAAYVGSKHAVGCASGTDALLLALMALGVGDGDEVITTPFSFFATAGSIWRTGATPVFVDIEEDTFNIDPDAVQAAITDKTKAIMPVHLFGQCAEMAAILEAAGDIPIVEDAAQALSAGYRGAKAGAIGTIGCFSFFPSKNLGGFGDGGMVVTQDEELGEKIRQCRNHGSKPKYYHKWVGGNFRLDTLQAAGLIVKLPYLEQWHAGRRANAARYNELLADVAEVTTPVIRDDNESIYNQYVLRVPHRDQCRQFLKDNDIGCEIYYPVSMHEQECFAALGHKVGGFPESEKAAAETLAIPVYPELTDEQQQYVVDKIKEFLAAGT